MGFKSFQVKRSKFTGILLIVLLVGFLGFAVRLQAVSSDDIDLFELAFENRSALIRGEVDPDITRGALDNYIYQFDPEDLEVLVESNHLKRLKAEEPGVKSLNSISLEEALEDVDFLIKTLRYGYAGYQIYGGDERFNQSRQDIIAELESEAGDSSNISMDKFEEIIYTGLNFIEDNHFALAGREMGEEYTLYLCDEHIFNKVEENGESSYVLAGEEDIFFAQADEKADLSLWPGLGEEGQLIYLPGIFMPRTQAYEEGLKVEIPLISENGDSDSSIEVLLYPVSSFDQSNSSKIYHKTEVEGIPLIEIKSFAAMDGETMQQLEEFVADAAYLKDYENLIIDIRGNTGGSDQFAYEWLQSFTGQENISRNILNINLRTDFSARLMENLLVFFPEETQEYVRQHTNLLNPVEDGWGDVHMAAPKFISGDTKIVVLIDSQVMSAGESFVRYLQQLENVMFLGSNTRGMGLVGNRGRFELLNSGIEVLGGITIFLDTDLVIREGRGYKPDFWVEHDQARRIAAEILKDSAL